MKPLLIEIGVEELPAAPLNRALADIPVKYRSALKSRGFESDFEFDFTPRRLVFFHKSFPESGGDRVETLFGPPIEAAFQNGAPSPAAIGFAKKCGVAIEELGRSSQKGREVLSYEKKIAGKSICEVLNEALPEFLNGLNLGKTMRWGETSYEFSRPVRWLLVMHGENAIACELFGVKSAPFTYAHRMKSFSPILTHSAEKFGEFLAKNGVILSAKKRREIILDQIASIEKEKAIRVEKDSELLDEVVAITEYPTALLGKFDQGFLELPEEAIITSMKTNQRYFAVYENEKLANKFIVVANALTDDFSAVVSGNEKVLRPRLSDALFFWRNDLQNGLQNEPLKMINYAQGLGSIYDKQLREVEIVKRLTEFFGVKDEFALRAAELSKRDLATQMVYEFTELQGVMGMRYAAKLGEKPEVARAIYEQYLPLGEESKLPESQAGALLAIATKTDSLMSLFSIGLIPSGSKDPLALRRAAASIAKIALDRGWKLPIAKFLAAFADLYKSFDLSVLADFFKERLFGVLGANQSMIKAVLATGDDDILSIASKVAALENISKNSGFKENISLFKRVANILKDQDLSGFGAIDATLFEAKEESDLYAAFGAIHNTIKADDANELLAALFELKNPLDRFFGAVMVNAENQRVRANRLALIAAIYREFLRVADIKEISF